MKFKEITGAKPVLKCQGCGNDFIVLADFDDQITASQVKKLCARHYGIGADGLIAVMDSRNPAAEYRMKFFNPDGSRVEMCGNGIRCFIKYLADLGLVRPDKPVPVDTDAGIITAEIIDYTQHSARVKVDMGKPIFVDSNQVSLPAAENGIVTGKVEGFPFTFVSMGNPHVVIFCDNPETLVKEYGERIESNLGLFPQKVNVEFARVNTPEDITMYVWERGAGETLACGTGACATFVASKLAGSKAEKATLYLRGGELEIAWHNRDEAVFMTGDATRVFEILPGSLDSLLF